MKRILETAFMAWLALLLVASTGCEVTPSDVDAAKNEVREQQNETAQARADGDKAISEKEQREKVLRETAMRRPNDSQAQKKLDDAEKETAKARELAAEKLANEQREAEAAKAEAARLAAELRAKEARDNYAKDMDTELEKVDVRIEAMRDRLAKLEGAELEKLSADIEVLKVRREAFADAVYALKNEEPMKWETKKAAVEQAHKDAQQDIE